jgi:hypothetical protein
MADAGSSVQGAPSSSEPNMPTFPRTVGVPEEIRWMRRALRLADRGFTPPNPMVG